MQEFPTFVSQALPFLEDLAANNSRDWFNDNKSRYEADCKGPAKALMDVVAADLARDPGVAARPKMFRINRDLRFSKDKTPYNTHLHFAWEIEGSPLAYLFGLSPSYCQIGVCAMGLDQAQITRWREAVAQGHEVLANVRKLQSDGWFHDAPPLKRVPSPWPQDHPEEELLRMKGFVLWSALPPGAQATPVASILSGYRTADGFRQALGEAIS